jgi:hypothetical protein
MIEFDPKRDQAAPNSSNHLKKKSKYHPSHRRCSRPKRGSRVVPCRYGLVSWSVMRLPVSFSVFLIAGVVGLCVPAANLCAQGAAGQSSSSQNTPVQNTPNQTTPNGTYISVDPLAKVRYDNKYDVSLTMAYDHMKAGPTLLQGSNLGGLDLTGSMWMSKRWALQATARSFWGTSGAAPNAPLNIRGPFVSEYYFAAGPEWLGPHNKHGAILAHAMFGGVYGKFEQDLRGQPPSVVGFYNDQIAPTAIIGGHFDLNRSPRWVFRITPDALMKWYSIDYGTKSTQWDVNFGISVGLEYKFKKTR